MKKFYVYKVYHEGRIIYVGKGSGARGDHVLSGCSKNKILNEYYFRHTLLGEALPTLVKEYVAGESSALKLEHELIYVHKPVGNTLLKYSVPIDYVYGVDCLEDDVDLSKGCIFIS